MTRIAFDIRAAIPAAWAALWANNLKQRAKDAKSKHVYRAGSTYYLTASDVENQVREFAGATADGKPWSEAPIAFGKPMRWPVLRFSGDLKGAVRGWLLSEVRAGRLASHNFGRGHISGMRFRPAGEPLSEAEGETIARKEERRANPKPAPKHFSTGGYGGRPICSKPRGGFYGRRSTAWTTKNKSEVTCVRCKNLLAALAATVAEEA